MTSDDQRETPTRCPDCSGEGGDSYYGACSTCLGSGEMPDQRLFAATWVIWRSSVWGGTSSAPTPTVQDRDLAKAVLAAADGADYKAGIHRVKVDDETVEKVARVLQTKSYEMRIPWDDYKRVARAVLAALTGAES